MYFYGWELILSILDDDSCQLSKVLGNLWRTVSHDQNILCTQFIKELSVVVNAGEKRLGS